MAVLSNAKEVFEQFECVDMKKMQKKYKLADVIHHKGIEVDSSVIDRMTNGIIVTEASPADYRNIAERVINRYGRVYAEAFNQAEEKLSAAEAKLRWRDVGIDVTPCLYCPRHKSLSDSCFDR